MLHTIVFQRIMLKSAADCVMRWISKSIHFFVQEQPIYYEGMCSMCDLYVSKFSRIFLMRTNILHSEKLKKALKINIDEIYSNLVQLEDEGKSSVEEVGKLEGDGACRLSL